MPTENRRVATYLPKHIDDRLEAFKTERGLKGDSPALIAILEDFFGVSQQVAHSSKFEIADLLAQVESLAAKVTHLENELLSELKSSPRGDLKSELLGELQGELFDRLKPDLKSELLSELRSELREVNSLNLPPGQLTLLPNEAMRQVANDSDLPSEPRSEPQSENISDLSGEPASESAPTNVDKLFRTGELAKRLGVDSSTVSHWRPAGRREKTPDELLNTTRKADPDGIGWIYLPDVKRFKPERSIPSESLTELTTEQFEEF
jgi:hypothetical protein